jgi:UDP-N-acetylglucosamine 2-epimerase (non-hydrolysing)
VDTNHRKFILITLHRREKFGREFRRVLGTIVKLAKQYPHYNFVYPVHLNPNVKQPVNEHLLGFDNIVLIPPVDYLTFAYLMRQCHFIISDSGGIQEECHTFGKPILVLREVTERMEAVKAGYAYLLGSDETKILRTFRQVDDRLRAGYNYFRQPNPYGDGTAAKQIVNILKRSL